MKCEDLRLNAHPRVDREKSHKFAVNFDGKMCVVGLRASAQSPNTALYSPLARRHLALRGTRPLPRRGASTNERGGHG